MQTTILSSSQRISALATSATLLAVPSSHPEEAASRTVWLIQMERGDEHDADVASTEQAALQMALDHLERYVAFGIDRPCFLTNNDYRETVRARAAAADIFYTVEKRQL